jgi:hypothetical protein
MAAWLMGRFQTCDLADSLNWGPKAHNFSLQDDKFIVQYYRQFATILPHFHPLPPPPPRGVLGQYLLIEVSPSTSSKKPSIPCTWLPHCVGGGVGGWGLTDKRDNGCPALLSPCWHAVHNLPCVLFLFCSSNPHCKNNIGPSGTFCFWVNPLELVKRTPAVSVDHRWKVINKLF